MARVVEDAVMMNCLIHQSVRRDLRRFDAALGAFTAGDRERAKALAELFGHFDQMLTDHHHSEETHLWPIISGSPGDAATVAKLTAEHEHMVRSLSAALRDLERDGGFALGMWFLQWVADETGGDDQTFLERTVPRHVRWLSARVAGRKYRSATAAAVGEPDVRHLVRQVLEDERLALETGPVGAPPADPHHELADLPHLVRVARQRDRGVDRQFRCRGNEPESAFGVHVPLSQPARRTADHKAPSVRS